MGMKVGGGDGGSGAHRAPASKPDINMTPLIDVLLVLLIIFMVISPVKPHEFETKIPERPPESSEIEIIPDPSTLVISMAPKTLELKLNDKPMTPDELSRYLTDELKKRPSDKKSIFIKAPKSVPYREVVRVVDIAKGAGAEPIGLQVDYLED